MSQGLEFRPYLLGGTNVAFGGAELDTSSDTSHVGTPNIGAQIGGYASAGGTFSSNDLISIWGGGNDFLSGATNPAQVAGFVTTHLNSIYALGGRKILVPNLPLLGLVPRNYGTANEAPANAASIAFNMALAANLAAFRATHADATIYELDVQALFTSLRNNPSLLGLTDVTHSYLSTGGVADEFMFWDEIHPTRVVHEYLGNQAAALVPEPASFAVLSVALVSLLRRKRA